MGTTSEKEIKKKEPLIHVGVLQNQKKIEFSLLSNFKLQGKEFSKGEYIVEIENGQISFNGERYDQLTFEPDHLHNDSFEIKDVVIGVQFHWERRENQQFLGGLKFISTGEGAEKAITAINIVSLEDYLRSVISSEMSSTSSEELLKAHAIVSRSWLLAQIIKNQSLDKDKKKYRTSIVTSTEVIQWYDREDHDHFDVCADDHCQRYQGITRQSTDLVNRVVNETFGKVVSYQGSICDTRYSKCCGGVMETFENVWEPTAHPYLQGKPDNFSGIPLSDLCSEENAEKWIRSSPDAFCNTQNSNVLKQVLNDYDRETADFFRWIVIYSQKELSTIIKERSGIDFGDIIDLQPLERGTSGRISRLKVIGTLKVMVFGRELEIRKTLSKSHLYSSAFVVDTLDEDDDGIPQEFVLTGAGWGHGVGLCQIGAAMMAEKGYKHNEILNHYYPDTNIKTKY